MAQVINDSNFEEIIKSGKPVVIDFWATWCGPCRMISPIIDELATEYEDKVIIAKCNVDECSGLPAQFGVRNIPTLLFFKDGQLSEKSVGAATKKDIVKKIEALLA